MDIRNGRYKKMSLEMKKNDIEKRISLIKCTQKRIGQETSFCICLKASMTVEAVVVVPVGMGVLLLILFFFRFLFVQAAIEDAVLYTGRVLAVESSLLDTEESLFLSAEGMIKYILSQEDDVNRYVSGGSLGVSLLGSEFSNQEIELKANCIVKFPIEFFGKKGVVLTSEHTFVKWTGDVYEKTEGEEWVYITETGSVYHKDTSCRVLDLSIQQAKVTDMPNLRGINGQKYYPCEKCIKDETTNTTVYYTGYGTLYHANLSCSALKRTVYKVLKSEVEDRRACSFCYSAKERE